MGHEPLTVDRFRDVGAHPQHNLDAGLAQDLDSSTGDLRKGVLERHEDARDARFDEGLRAGRRPAVVATGLEGHRHGRALKRDPLLAGQLHRFDFGVRGAGLLVVPQNDAPVLREDRATHAGVGTNESGRSTRFVQREPHEIGVGHGFEGVSPSRRRLFISAMSSPTSRKRR